MKFYKIIQNDIILGVVNGGNFVQYQSYPSGVIYSLIKDAHFVLFEGILYHTSWLHDVSKVPLEYKEADIVSISESEYNILLNAFETNQEITNSDITEETYIDDSYNEENLIEPEPTEPTTEYIRSIKLKEMSYNCNKTITNGFDIILSDGNSYHFSLTTQDQLNLITLSSMVESGETQIPYHADGEPCKFYSATDIKSIINKATEFKTYHISYYNSLKTYINSMETMEEISEVTYGIEIPAEYQSEVLKAII